jgi:hypothetical protein
MNSYDVAIPMTRESVMLVAGCVGKYYKLNAEQVSALIDVGLANRFGGSEAVIDEIEKKMDALGC